MLSVEGPRSTIAFGFSAVSEPASMFFDIGANTIVSSSEMITPMRTPAERAGRAGSECRVADYL